MDVISDKANDTECDDDWKSGDWIEEVTAIPNGIRVRVVVAYWEQKEADASLPCDDCGDPDFTITYPIPDVEPSQFCYAWNHMPSDGSPAHENSASKFEWIPGAQLSFRQWTTLSCSGGTNEQGTEKTVTWENERDNPTELCSRLWDVEIPNLLTRGWHNSYDLGAGEKTNLNVNHKTTGSAILIYYKNDKWRARIAKNWDASLTRFQEQFKIGWGQHLNCTAAMTTGLHGGYGIVVAGHKDKSVRVQIGTVTKEQLDFSFNGNQDYYFDKGNNYGNSSVALADQKCLVGFSMDDNAYLLAGLTDSEWSSIDFNQEQQDLGLKVTCFYVDMDLHGNVVMAYIQEMNDLQYALIKTGTFNANTLTVDDIKIANYDFIANRIKNLKISINDTGYGILSYINANGLSVCEVLKANMSNQKIDWSTITKLRSNAEFSDITTSAAGVDNRGNVICAYETANSIKYTNSHY